MSSLLTPEQRIRVDEQCAKVAREREHFVQKFLEPFQNVNINDLADYEATALATTIRLIKTLDPVQFKVWAMLSEHKTAGFISGRRVGKSYLATALVAIRMMMYPNTNCLIVAPTLSDVTSIHLEGEQPGTGMLQIIPKSLIRKSSLGTAPFVTLVNGSRCDFIGAVKPEKGRGHGYRIVVFDEANFYSSWRIVENVQIAVSKFSIGDRQREILFTTTPQFSPIFSRIKETCGKNIMTVPTWEAIHRYAADEAWLRDVYFRLENTPTGRRELFAEVPNASDYACFTQEQYEDSIREDSVPERDQFLDVVVSVDHSITPKATDGRSETGIVVLAKHQRPDTTVPDVWVLDENSVETGNPEIWVPAAKEMVKRYGATRYIVEDNQGGMLIEHAIRTKDKRTPISHERAVKGKEERSMEARAVMDEKRVFFAKPLPRLASQCIEFAPKSAPDLKFDRADAYIQGVRMLVGRRMRKGFVGVA